MTCNEELNNGGGDQEAESMWSKPKPTLTNLLYAGMARKQQRASASTTPHLTPSMLLGPSNLLALAESQRRGNSRPQRSPSRPRSAANTQIARDTLAILDDVDSLVFSGDQDDDNDASFPSSNQLG